jgi:hypothetical protein
MRNTNSSYISTRRSGSWNRNQNKVKYRSENKFGPVTHTVVVALVVTVLGLIYLTQAAKVTNYDYEAQRIDSEISELLSKKEDLEIENARLTALSTISSSEVAQEMTEPTNVKYLSE